MCTGLFSFFCFCFFCNPHQEITNDEYMNTVNTWLFIIQKFLYKSKNLATCLLTCVLWDSSSYQVSARCQVNFSGKTNTQTCIECLLLCVSALCAF